MNAVFNPLLKRTCILRAAYLFRWASPYRSNMGIEYKIKFVVPKNFKPTALFNELPCPIERGQMAEIYNYAIEPDGFYFVDHLVNRGVAAVALRRFIDEALAH